MGQIFVNNIGYTHFTPMRLKSEAPNALLEFIQNVGIPSQIQTDDAKELVKGRWKEICQTHGIKQTQTEPYSPFQNRAEVNIRELKKQTRRLMSSTKTPPHLWDLCTSYVAELRCLTAQPLYSLHGRTPFELITGNTPDISEYISHSWYDPVWYYDSTSFPDPTRHLGRWIGVAHNIGQAMCFWVLSSSGTPIARSTIQPISEAELRSNVVQKAISDFDQAIKEKIGGDPTEDSLAFEIGSDELNKALADADEDGHFLPVEPDAEKPDADDYDEETYSKFTSAEVLLPKDGYEYIAKVIGRKRDGNGNPVGQYNPNPILDATVHEVQFPDGRIQKYAANVLAEALYAHVDNDGNRWLLLKSIIAHEKGSNAPTKSELERCK
jgi:hypothetical protein